MFLPLNDIRVVRNSQWCDGCVHDYDGVDEDARERWFPNQGCGRSSWPVKGTTILISATDIQKREPLSLRGASERPSTASAPLSPAGISGRRG